MSWGYGKCYEVTVKILFKSAWIKLVIIFTVIPKNVSVSLYYSKNVEMQCFKSVILFTLIPNNVNCKKY